MAELSSYNLHINNENYETTTEDDTALHTQVSRCINIYLATMSGEVPKNLYQICMEQVEPPLIKSVLEYCNGNQTQASKILGISRGTLKKKCDLYQID